MTVEELLQEFTLAKRAEGVADATLGWYISLMSAFGRWLAIQSDASLDPATMKRYLVYLRDRHKTPKPNGEAYRPYSVHSIVSIHRCLRSFFRWCQDEELIDQSPMVGVRVKKPDPAEPRRATEHEVKALIRSIPVDDVDDWVSLRDHLIVHAIFYCALRVGELVQLEAHHFDLANGLLHIPGGKTGAGVVPLLPEVVSSFEYYKRYRPQVHTAKLFVSSHGTGSPRGELTTNGVRVMLRRRCEQAGIRYLNPHSFRHGIAMHLLNDKRVDATMVQRILRHANLRTTTTFYAQWTLGALADQYESVMNEE